MLLGICVRVIFMIVVVYYSSSMSIKSESKDDAIDNLFFLMRIFYVGSYHDIFPGRRYGPVLCKGLTSQLAILLVSQK